MNEKIKQAANIIKQGGLVAFPTETVYGLGADATNEEACSKIFKIKGRPSINPLIVHIASIAQAESISIFNEDAYKLLTFWSGPLSIVLPLNKNANIAKSVLAGLDTIALRLPAHPIALQLLKEAGCPIAAPSANPSGYISATTTEHVQQHFANQDVFILSDNSSCQYGLESTIIDLTTPAPTILRYGFITPDSIESIIGKKVSTAPPLMTIKAPGMMDKHYSPQTPLRLNATDLEQGEIGLGFGEGQFRPMLNLSSIGNIVEAAANLYLMLRQLDDYASSNQISRIAVAPIPNSGIGLAINDRLKRAASL